MAKLINVRLTTGATEKPITKSYFARNPYVRNGYLSDIILTGDAEFTKNGAIEVFIGSLRIFSNATTGSFKDLKQVTLPMQGRIIPAGRSIDIFVWKREESNEDVSVTITAGIFGDTNEINASVIPADEIEIDVDNSDVVDAIEKNTSDRPNRHKPDN